MGSGQKQGSSNRCCTACAVVMGILLLASLGGLSGTSYFLRTIIPFTDVGVLKTLTGCADCPACMTCLTGVTGEDVDGLCDPLANIFQCVVQFVYLYGRPNYGQPCYGVCHPCEQCLETTTFGSLGRLDKTMWETTFPDYLQTPESMGYTDYSLECSNQTAEMCELNITTEVVRRKRSASPDLCCGTASHQLQYESVYTDPDSAVKWYPVWFNIPWKKHPLQYQFFHDVECHRADLSCDPSIHCQKAERLTTFLMSSKKPHRRYGFTYQLLVLPDKKVKFINFPLPSHCHCLN